ncbi:peptide ABC transporter substrate-binding protein [Allorhizobium sp. BGMRC 0089]|nr:peptide ABC transporter substrate-binding protein [Allorhizobium sonneratiae]
MKWMLISTALTAMLMATPSLAATVAPGDKLAKNQDLSLRLLDSVKTLDPQLNSDTDGSAIDGQLFEGLYTQAPDGKLVPGVATGYDVSPDKLTYTFHLRPDAKWSNGAPVTASDFVYAWQRLVNPKTASEYSWYLATMKVKNAQAIIDGKMPPSDLGVKAVDDHTFQVTLSEPISYLLPMVTHTSTFPVLKSVVEKYGDAWTQPGHMVGNGAYVLKQHDMGQQLVLARNPDYWDNAHTIINTVTFKIINDANQALTRYLAGELDVGPVPTGQYLRLKKEYPDQAHSEPEACTYGYLFNVGPNGPAALKDVRVREALSLAINRDVIVKNILQGGQRPAYSWTHWAMAGFKAPDYPEAHMTQAERDAKAKELLKEAGYGPNKPLKLTISYNTDEGHKKMAIAVQQFWKALGVDVTLENMEWKVLLDRYGKGQFQVGRYAWCADYDQASTFLNFFLSNNTSNYGRFANADYDKLIAQSSTSSDPNIEYDKAEDILHKQVPIAPVYFYTQVSMVKPDIRGLPVQNVLDNWYAKNIYRVAK